MNTEQKPLSRYREDVRQILHSEKTAVLYPVNQEQTGVTLLEMLVGAGSRIYISTDLPEKNFNQTVLAALEAAGKRGVPIHIALHGGFPADKTTADMWHRIQTIAHTFHMLPPLPTARPVREFILTDKTAYIEADYKSKIVINSQTPYPNRRASVHLNDEMCAAICIKKFCEHIDALKMRHPISRPIPQHMPQRT